MRALALACVLVAQAATAFSTSSAFGEPCHERLTAEAVEGLALPLVTPLDAPDDVRFAAWVRSLLRGRPVVGDADQTLTSLVVGVRFPDVEESTPRDLVTLREAQLTNGLQAAHALRGLDHVGPGANAKALAAARAQLLDLTDRAFDAHQTDTTPVEVRAWVEHYGSVPVRIDRPLFLLGQALHLLQDSFSHTYRSADGRRVLAVMTYLGAFERPFVEVQSGPRHSVAMDRCETDAVSSTRAFALEASREMVLAVQHQWLTGDRSQVEAVVDRWMQLEPGCDLANHYCDAPLLEVGRTEETTGCSTGAGLGPLAVFLFWLRRRRS